MKLVSSEPHKLARKPRRFEPFLSHSRLSVRRTENPKAEVRFLAVPQTKMMLIEFLNFAFKNFVN